MTLADKDLWLFMDSRDLEFQWQAEGIILTLTSFETDQTVTIPVLINLQTLIDEQKCYETVRQLRWTEGVTCCKCSSKQVVKRGFDETQPHRQRYQCQACQSRFDDLSHTIFAGHHQPLQTWILCLYLLGLNLSTHQIAAELDLNKDDAQQMTSQLRSGIVEKKPNVILSGEVECDEMYLVAGFKGQQAQVKKRGAKVAQGVCKQSQGGVH